MQRRSDSELVNKVGRSVIFGPEEIRAINAFRATRGEPPVDVTKLGRKRPDDIRPGSRRDDRKDWYPTEDGATVISIVSDLGAEKVREYLLGKFRSVEIWFIYEVLGRPEMRDYVWRCRL